MVWLCQNWHTTFVMEKEKSCDTEDKSVVNELPDKVDEILKVGLVT